MRDCHLSTAPNYSRKRAKRKLSSDRQEDSHPSQFYILDWREWHADDADGAEDYTTMRYVGREPFDRLRASLSPHEPSDSPHEPSD